MLDNNYVKIKKLNDDLADEYLRLLEQLRHLPLEKEMLRLRRKLVKLEKQKQLAHKTMSDAWQQLKEATNG